jgi:hypothetical protein
VAPAPPPPPAPPARRGFFARLFRRRAPAPPPPKPAPVATPGPLPAIGAARGQEILTGTLDALGSAHHRPFSR